MAMRTVTWTVGSDGSTVTPITPQNGGVQGEENATLVVFRFGAESPLADSTLQLYIECLDNAGGYDKTPPLAVEDGQVSVLLPLAWTQYGGISTLRLVGERNGNILYTLEGRLRFASRQTAARQVDGLLRTHIQQTLNEVETAAVTAEASAAQAAASAAAAEIAEETAEAARRASAEAVEKAAQAGQAAAAAEESAKAAASAAATVAPIDDDAVTYTHPWSSKNAVDKLCKPFTLTGETVVCHPVEHYPLGVSAAIEPIQEGSGDPSPENVRPIRGRDSVTVTHNGTTHTIPLGETVYGGSVDVTGGVLTIDRALATFDGSEDEGWYINSQSEKYMQLAMRIKVPAKTGTAGISDKYVVLNEQSYTQARPFVRVKNGIVWYEGVAGEFADLDAFKAYLAENPFTICYHLAEPIAVQLSSQSILAQGGSNTLYADSGAVTVTGRETPLPTADNVGEAVGVSVDGSLTRSGYAADAAVTGRRLDAAEERLDTAEAAQATAAQRLDVAEERLDTAEAAQAAAETRLDAVETAQAEATERLSGAEKSLKALEGLCPVGCVYITSGDNPTYTFGGEWTLVKKEFKELSRTFTATEADSPLSAGVNEAFSDHKLHVERSGQCLRIIVSATNSIALDDTERAVCTINWNALGITDTFASIVGAVAGRDAANAVIQYSVDKATGLVQILDIIPKKDGDTVAAGNVIDLPIMFNIDSSRMLDEACDKFYWKRTS